jgi:hypothetical protein
MAGVIEAAGRRVVEGASRRGGDRVDREARAERVVRAVAEGVGRAEVPVAGRAGRSNLCRTLSGAKLFFAKCEMRSAKCEVIGR